MIKKQLRKQKKLVWNTQKMQLEQVLVTYLQISNYRKEHIWQDQVLAQIFELQHGGETHGAGVGVVVDGCPAGLPLEREDVQKYLDRRKPGQSKYTTQRKEGDQVEILSGIFEGRTTGTPISMVVYNKDQRSKDYSNIKDIYRPGHADFTFDMKYGFRDYRGGGRSSGRETIGRVAAGAVAAKVLKELGIEIKAYAKAIAGIEVSQGSF